MEVKKPHQKNIQEHFKMVTPGLICMKMKHNQAKIYFVPLP